MRQSGRWRSVTVHALEAVLQEVRAAEQTPEVQALLALRPLVERTIGHLMGRGLRQARYKGTAKVHFQALASALAANLRRLGTLFEADPRDEEGERGVRCRDPS